MWRHALVRAAHLVFACVALSPPTPCRADVAPTSEVVSPSEAPRFMLRGQPLPKCSSFAVIEIGVLKPVGDWALARGDKERALVGDYGYMRNVSPSEAWGGVFHVELGSFRSRTGVAVRRRAWIDEHQALDLQVGAILFGSEHEPYVFHAVGILLGVNYSLGDYVVLEAQTQTRSIRRSISDSKTYGPTDRTLVHHVGAKLGSGLGAAGTGAAIALGIFALFALTAALG